MIRTLFGSRRALLRLVAEELKWWAGARQHAATSLVGITRLVFVCRGNICRSAYAAEVARLLDFPAVSYGLRTEYGNKANAGMIQAAASRGHDLNNHETSPISAYVAQPGDLVVVFELSQLSQFTQMIPNARIIPLGRMSEPPRTYIHDPFMTTAKFYDRTSGLIEDSTRRLVEKIRQRVSSVEQVEKGA